MLLGERYLKLAGIFFFFRTEQISKSLFKKREREREALKQPEE